MSRRSGASQGHKRSKMNAGSERNDGEPRSKLAGGLYLVATPIGNAADISLRALDVIARADVVACEDSRVTRKLLARHGIRAKLTPYHEHNAAHARPRLLARLAEGGSVALVSDAGTPLISDPGYKLVRAALAQGSPVTAVPGASAALAGLLLSGLPTDRFFFGGFLPPRQAARRKALEGLAFVPATLVFFEAAPRLAETLADMAEVLGARPAAVARELTKLFEEVRRGSLAELAAEYARQGPPKGETVVIVGPPLDRETRGEDLEAMLARALESMSVRDAAAHVAKETGLPRREVYARALKLARRART